VNGVIVVDKPERTTSHGVVLRLRSILKISRTGHLGTLDPMATGVLPVCLGQATRLAQFLPSNPKEYIGAMRLGFETTTYDREGEPTTSEMPFTGGLAEIAAAAKAFTGTIEQIPPPYSAKKIDGKRSYKLARRGKVVEHGPSRVTVDTFEITSFENGIAGFRVVCSGGTYVRSLAHDVGRALGCGAHLSSLRRVRSGPFTIAEARPLHKISAADVIPMESLLADWPRIDVSGEEEVRVAHGNPVACALDARLTRIFNKKGEFIAIGEIEKGLAHPRVVLTSNPQVRSSELKAEA
jgi:tRNA pseudouridine55 synthase